MAPVDLHPFASEGRRINALMRQIRKLAPLREYSWKEPADILVKQEFLNGRTVSVLNITLTPSGCTWAKRGGCTMCGEFSGSLLGQPIPPEFHIAQAVASLAKFVPRVKTPWVRLYNEGSWTNPGEIDPLAAELIIRTVSLIKGIERITIETMAKEVTRDRLELLRAALIPPVELEIGIGLEAKDDIVRQILVNKGETLKTIARAVDLIKEFGFRSLAYVLIKPPFWERMQLFDQISIEEYRAMKARGE